MKHWNTVPGEGVDFSLLDLEGRQAYVKNDLYMPSLRQGMV